MAIKIKHSPNSHHIDIWHLDSLEFDELRKWLQVSLAAHEYRLNFDRLTLHTIEAYTLYTLRWQ